MTKLKPAGNDDSLEQTPSNIKTTQFWLSPIT
jgi:hypothetical protein